MCLKKSTFNKQNILKQNIFKCFVKNRLNFSRIAVQSCKWGICFKELQMYWDQSSLCCLWMWKIRTFRTIKKIAQTASCKQMRKRKFEVFSFSYQKSKKDTMLLSTNNKVGHKNNIDRISVFVWKCEVLNILSIRSIEFTRLFSLDHKHQNSFFPLERFQVKKHATINNCGV